MLARMASASVLHHILTASPEPAVAGDVAAWWTGHVAATAALAAASTVDRAIAGGFAADRPAWAFASGYHEALQRLVPALGGARAALCASEDAGAHPGAIKTALADG